LSLVFSQLFNILFLPFFITFFSICYIFFTKLSEHCLFLIANFYCKCPKNFLNAFLLTLEKTLLKFTNACLILPKHYFCHLLKQKMFFFFFSHYQLAATVPYRPRLPAYTPPVSNACILVMQKIGRTPYRKWHRDNMLAGYHTYSTQFYADTRPSTKPLKYPMLRHY
jgi:hypothetical protein